MLNFNTCINNVCNCSNTSRVLTSWTTQPKDNLYPFMQYCCTTFPYLQTLQATVTHTKCWVWSWLNYTQNAACSFRNCPLRNCPFTSVHMKKDTRLFHTASDGKLGGAWELGYGLLCTCLYPESGELQAGATALGLYKHNDDTYYILPIQPRSQALGAFVTCSRMNVCPPQLTAQLP